MLRKLKNWIAGTRHREGPVVTRPVTADARMGLAADAVRRGDYAGAEVLYQQVAKAAVTGKERAGALAELASIYQNFSRLAEARAVVEQALVACPEDPDLNYRMGLLHLSDSDPDGALDYFHLALHYSPALFHACVGRVKALLALGRADEEGLAYEEFLLANPGHAIASYTFAGWNHARGNYEKAADLLRPLAELDPPNREACNFLGLILGREYGRFEEAERILRRALLEDALWPPGVCNLGWILLEKGDYVQGMRLIDAALEHNPGDNEVRLIRGYMNLKRGEFGQGWHDYEARHRSHLAVERPYRFPEWNGSPVPGKRLLIYGEQGLGDQIMFASCFEEAMQRAGPCTIECNPKLVTLFARSFPSARIQTNVPSGTEPEWLAHEAPFDFQIPMGNLPGFLRLKWADFPAHRGYLRVAPDRVTYWRARLDELGPGPKIGISWNGGVKATRRHMRSIAPADIVPLLRQPARFVSLQYGECSDDLASFNRDHGVVLPHWSEALEDYDETAALVSALDLVVSVCTAVIHLAGALGKPVWVLAPAVPEWRYLDKGESLPWYPSARVIRQSRPGDWREVIGQVSRELPRA